MENLSSVMFNNIKNQFVSNLQQDLLALSGFMNEDELLAIIEKCVEVCKGFDEKRNQLKKDGKES